VTTLVPLIPKSPGNAYRGIGEIVSRNLEILWPAIEKLGVLDRAIIEQYVREIYQVMEDEDDND
jgi:hypothetical protein